MTGYVVLRRCLADTHGDGTGRWLPYWVYLEFTPATATWHWIAGFREHATPLSLEAAELVAERMRQESSAHLRDVVITVELDPLHRAPHADAERVARSYRRAA